MNHPTSFRGYNFYQSSYAMNPGQPATSYLSIARDPGMPLVFAGYIGTMIGMVIVLIRRARQHQRRSWDLLAVPGNHKAQRTTSESRRVAIGAALVDAESGTPHTTCQGGVTGNGDSEVDLQCRAASNRR